MRFITIPGRSRRKPGMETTTLVQTSAQQTSAMPEGPSAVAQYTLERTLGTGGQGDVFAAWDTLLLRPVALKRLRHPPSPDSDVHLQEARRSAGLRHAAFVRIHGVVNDVHGHWIVMERVFGRELSAVIQEGPVPLAQAVDLMTQAAQALAEVHRAGLAHGDIKPSNLMVQTDGDLRILDFGIAQAFDPIAGAGVPGSVQPGTRAYMAPERLMGAAPSPASDIFALGVVFLEMVGGHREDARSTATSHSEEGNASWRFPTGLPQAIRELIHAMGARHPSERPAGMDVIAQTLSGLALPVAPSSSPSVAVRSASTGSAWATTARVSLLLLTTGLIANDRPLPPLAVIQPAATDQQEMRDGISALRRFDEDGAIAKALQHFRTVAERSPKNAAASAWLALAMCISYRNEGHDEALLNLARTAAQRSIAIDDRLAVAQVAEGWTLELKGDRSTALMRFEEALRLDPDNLYALNGKIRILLAQQQYDAAIALAKEARTRHPDDRLYVDLMGSLYFERGDLAAAEREFRASIRLQPDAVFAYANLNATLLRLGRAEEALQVLQQGLQIRPAGRLYTNLGAALYARGDFKGAASAFEAAADGPHGSPNFYLRWANLADAKRWVPGESAASAAAYRRALQLLQPILEREPTPANLSRAALYEARLGLRQQALDKLSLLKQNPPKQPDPAFRIALAYEVLGQRAAALQSLGLALALGYPVALVDSEPELVALRRDAGFTSLMLNTQE